MGNDVSTVPLDFARILLNVNTNCLDSDNTRTKHFISTELDGETQLSGHGRSICRRFDETEALWSRINI